MKKRLWIGLLVFTVAVVFFFSAGAIQSPAKDKIRVGQAVALSGYLAPVAKRFEVPIMDLWIHEVNARGGLKIYPNEKPLPIELIRYDDKSDPGTCVNLYEKLITQDKCDIIFPPHGSSNTIAAGAVATKYKRVWIAWTASSKQLERSKYPYLFVMHPTEGPCAQGLVDIMAKSGAKSVAVLYIANDFGIAYVQEIVPRADAAGIEVRYIKSYPSDVMDMSPMLKRAQAANVDGLCVFSAPADTNLVVKQAIELNFNPKLFSVGLAGWFPSFRDTFGAAAEGIISFGYWGPSYPYPGVKEFVEHFTKFNGFPPDYNTAASGWATCQVLEQAWAKVGLDPDKLRDYVATGKFETITGPLEFVDQWNTQFLKFRTTLGQWQGGEYKLVAGKDPKLYTAEALYPKPPWPK